MLTLFTIPKPFRGHIGVIQRNALRSWKLLHPDIEVFLCGDDEGVGETAREMGFHHIHEGRKNRYGTPLLSDYFMKVHERARHPLMGYVNADIIFLDDLLPALERLPAGKVLMVGTRFNQDITGELAFDDGWRERLRAGVSRWTDNNRQNSSDYFIFRRNSGLHKLPDFAVGRPYWDNWMFLNAVRSRAKLIDASKVVLAVHQNHDYGHVAQAQGNSHNGPEGEENLRLAGNFDVENKPSLLLCNRVLLENGMLGRSSRALLLRDINRIEQIWPGRRRLHRLIFAARNALLRVAPNPRRPLDEQSDIPWIDGPFVSS